MHVTNHAEKIWSVELFNRPISLADLSKRLDLPPQLFIHAEAKQLVR